MYKMATLLAVSYGARKGGSIVSRDVSSVEKRLLQKQMFRPFRPQETFAEEAKCFWTNSETWHLQQMFPGTGNGETFASATTFSSH